MLTEPDGVTVTDESTLSVAVAPASVYTDPCAIVIGFVPVTVITGAVLSNVTELESVVDDTEAPALPAGSEYDDIENGTIQANFVHSRQTAGTQSQQHANAELRHEHPHDATENRQQQTLSHKLPPDSLSWGTQRDPHRDFALPPSRSGQHEIGHVDASD